MGTAHWRVLAILLLAIPGEQAVAQGRPVLGTDGSNRIVLEGDSMKFIGDVAEYPVAIVSPDGKVLTRRYYQLDCELVKARTRLTTRWTMWSTVIEATEAAAFKHLCAPVAGRWAFMFSAANGEYLIDRATIDTVPMLRSGRRVWLKLAHDSTEAVVGTTRRANHVMVRYDIDCAARRLRTLAQFEYDVDGKIIDCFDTPPDAAQWSSIIPESNGEAIAEWVCRTLPILDSLLPVRRR